MPSRERQVQLKCTCRSLLFLRLSKHNANKLFHRLHEATEQFVTQRSLKSALNCYIFTRNHLSCFAKSGHDLFRFLAMALATSATLRGLEI